MAVKIRLMRVGKKKQPSYRVVVADSRKARDGRFIEIVGQYAPREEPSLVSIDTDRIVHWLRQGAQPTEQTAKIFEIAGVWDAYKQATGKDSVAKPRPKAPKEKAAQPEAEAPPAPVSAPPADGPEAEASTGAAVEESGE